MSSVANMLARTAVIAGLAVSASQAHAACTFGSSGEPSLQSTFDGLLGASAPDASTACVADGGDTSWTTVGSVGSIDIIVELAGNAQSNSFGVYDPMDPSSRLMVFDGAAGPDSQATLRLRQTTSGWVVRVQELGQTGWNSMALSTSAFGFYLGTANQGTFFSDTALNSDGVDHMYAYAGTGGAFLGGPLSGEIFSVQDFILAWEDLAGGGDRDYQDFVAIVTDIKPVPVPTAVWLLASGLIGLAGVARRHA